jgi:hypothetical protein
MQILWLFKLNSALQVELVLIGLPTPGRIRIIICYSTQPIGSGKKLPNTISPYNLYRLALHRDRGGEFASIQIWEPGVGAIMIVVKASPWGIS